MVRQHLGDASLPQCGSAPGPLLAEAADLLFKSLAPQRPSAVLGLHHILCSPVGALGDLLAAAVNPNVGAWQLSPIASEIESADGTLDRGADWLSPGLRRPDGQRWQYGQFRRLLCRTRGQGTVVLA